MRVPPDGIDDRRLRRSLEEHWDLAPAWLGGPGVRRRAGSVAMSMYPMRWSPDEIALSLSDFRGPHERNDDTELTWAVLTEETGNTLRLVP